MPYHDYGSDEGRRNYDEYKVKVPQDQNYLLTRIACEMALQLSYYSLIPSLSKEARDWWKQQQAIRALKGGTA